MMADRRSTQTTQNNNDADDRSDSGQSIDSLQRTIDIQKVYDETTAVGLIAAKRNKPSAFLNTHFLEQFDKKGFFRSVHPDVNKRNEAERHSLKYMKNKLQIEVAVSVLDLLNINLIEGCFTVKMKIYSIFELDLYDLGLIDLAEQALETGYFATLSAEDEERLQAQFHLPKLVVFNHITTESTERGEVRVYGGKQGFTAIMTTTICTVKCHQSFALQNFPFDLQNLAIELRIDDPKGAQKYVLNIHTVQFHKQALAQVEWNVMAPLTHMDASNDSNAQVLLLPVQRLAAFYVQNIILVMAVLPMLALISFIMRVEDLGNRSNTVLTLILTAVTFKFTAVSGSLPKVPYNTQIDYFMIYSLTSLTSSAITTVIPTFFPAKLRSYVNYACAGFSILILTLMFSVWAFQCRKILKKHSRVSVIVPELRGQNWYCFRYSSPAFIVDQHTKGRGKATKML